MALPVSPDPTDRRAAVVRMLEESPDGLSDTALAQQLGEGVRPQTVNQLCRRMVAEGTLERVGTRPILNRLPAPTPRRARRTKATAARGNGSAEPALSEQNASPIEASRGPEPAPTGPVKKPRRTSRPASANGTAEPAHAEENASPIEASSEPEPAPARPATKTRRQSGPASTINGAPEVAPSERDASQIEASAEAESSPTEPAKKTRRRSGPASSSNGAREATSSEENASLIEASVEVEPTSTAEAPIEPASSEQNASTIEASADAEPTPTVETPAEAPDTETCAPPTYDALQAWSRVVNVQSLVAGWLVRRGATLRWASADGSGPARDLVASLDGDDVHVEVTGWPSDGARTHPTTIAGDWFSAAEHAAAERRRAHPRARIVIALPDTRRYRSLTEQRSASLHGAGAEVWFVDAAGAVHAR